jgi:hypothetical protein
MGMPQNFGPWSESLLSLRKYFMCIIILDIFGASLGSWVGAVSDPNAKPENVMRSLFSAGFGINGLGLKKSPKVEGAFGISGRKWIFGTLLSSQNLGPKRENAHSGANLQLEKAFGYCGFGDHTHWQKSQVFLAPSSRKHSRTSGKELFEGFAVALQGPTFDPVVGSTESA